MSTLRFHIVDVFAESKYSGNQLAVVLGAARLTTDEMQAIARETHFSETTFVLADQPRDGGWDVRIFTPGAEVPFAGHPTLGTAHVIRNEFLGGTASRVVLNLGVGPIPVTVARADNGAALYWMRQIEPTFGRTIPRETIAAVLGIEPGEIDDRFPVAEVSTGLPHVIVPLRNLAALQRIRVNRANYDALVDAPEATAQAVMAFTTETHQPGNDVAVRMFADALGVSEDPATGSGNGCLAAYLVRHRVLGSSAIDARSEQGYEILRPSLLRLRARELDGRIEVDVGGTVIDIARGELL